MYRWVVFVHIAGAFLFLMAHGGSVNVLLKLRAERDLSKVRALLELSTSSLNLMYSGLGLLLLGGVIAGFMGHWWGRGWIWTALGLLVVIMMAMYMMANTYYHRVRRAVGLPYMAKWTTSKESPPEDPVSAEQLDALLSTSQPWTIAAVGFGGLALILWLMLFKPF